MPNIENGFEQIKGFYSWVFDNQQKNIRTTHISLYMFLINQNNRNRWVEWFKCPFDLAMGGSGISNKKTYYNTLIDLQDWNLIKYQKGVNNFKAPLIKIEVLFDTSTVPQSEPQLSPQVIPLPVPLCVPQLYNNIKHITSNIELITINVFKVVDFIKNDLKPNLPSVKTNSIKTLKVFRQEILDCYDSCINYFPDDLIPKGQKEIDKWLDAIEKLNRLDKWKFEDIIAIVAKTREDLFWQKNFLSMAKLRTKDKEGLQYINVFYNKFRIDLNSKNNENKRQYIAELTKRYPNI